MVQGAALISMELEGLGMEEQSTTMRRKEGVLYLPRLPAFHPAPEGSVQP